MMTCAAISVQKLWRIKLERLKLFRLQQAAILAKENEMKMLKILEFKRMASIEEEKRIIRLATLNAERWVKSKSDTFDFSKRGSNIMIQETVSSFNCSEHELSIIQNLENHAKGNFLLSSIQVKNTKSHHKSETKLNVKSIHHELSRIGEVPKEKNSIENVTCSESMDTEKDIDNRVLKPDSSPKAPINNHEKSCESLGLKKDASKASEQENKPEKKDCSMEERKTDPSPSLKLPLEMTKAMPLKPSSTNINTPKAPLNNCNSTGKSISGLDAQKLIIEARKMRDAQKTKQKTVVTHPATAFPKMNIPKNTNSSSAKSIKTGESKNVELKENTQIIQNKVKRINEWDWVGSW